MLIKKIDLVKLPTQNSGKCKNENFGIKTFGAKCLNHMKYLKKNASSCIEHLYASCIDHSRFLGFYFVKIDDVEILLMV